MLSGPCSINDIDLDLDNLRICLSISAKRSFVTVCPVVTSIYRALNHSCASFPPVCDMKPDNSF